MTELERALEKLRSDLQWRGPNGREARYVVIEREGAMALLDALTTDSFWAKFPQMDGQ